MSSLFSAYRTLTRSIRIDQSFHDKRLTGQLQGFKFNRPNLPIELLEFASFGIGVHHAGLTMDDRRATEDLYLKKTLRIVIATSVCCFT